MFTSAGMLQNMANAGGTRGIPPPSRERVPEEQPTTPMNSQGLMEQIVTPPSSLVSATPATTPTPAPPPIEDTTMRGKLYKSKSGKYIIDNGESRISINQLYKSKKGNYIVEMPDGEQRAFVPYRGVPKVEGVEDTTLAGGSDGSLFMDAASRIGGGLIGLANLPFAFLQELNRASGDPETSVWRMPDKAVMSGLRSVFVKGDWGASYGDAFKQITGMTINDYFSRKLEGKFGDNYETKIMSVINPLSSEVAVDYVTDNYLTSFNPDELARRKEAVKVLSKISGPTHEILTSIAADPLIASGIAKGVMVPFSKVLAKMKSNKALSKVPEYMKMIKELTSIKEQGSLRMFHIFETLKADPALQATNKVLADAMQHMNNTDKARGVAVAAESKAKLLNQQKAIEEAKMFFKGLDEGEKAAAAEKAAMETTKKTIDDLAKQADEAMIAESIKGSGGVEDYRSIANLTNAEGTSPEMARRLDTLRKRLMRFVDDGRPQEEITEMYRGISKLMDTKGLPPHAMKKMGRYREELMKFVENRPVSQGGSLGVPPNAVDPTLPAAQMMTRAAVEVADTTKGKVKALIESSITQSSEDVYTGLNKEYKKMHDITDYKVQDPETIAELARVREELMGKAYKNFVEGERVMGEAYKKSVNGLIDEGNSPEMVREYGYAKENAMRELEGRPHLSDPDLPATKEAVFEQNLLGAMGFEQVGKFMEHMGGKFIKAGKWTKGIIPNKVRLSEDVEVVTNAIRRMISEQMKSRKMYSSQEGPLHHMTKQRGLNMKVTGDGSVILENIKTGVSTEYKSIAEVRKVIAPEFKTAKAFVAKMNEAELRMSTDVEMDAFYSRMFPDGMEFVTGKELIRRGTKWEKQILKGKKGNINIGILGRVLQFPEMVLGKTPSGTKFYNILRESFATSKNLFGHSWGKYTDTWSDNVKRYKKESGASSKEIKEAVRYQADSRPKLVDGKAVKDENGEVIYESLAYLDPDNIGKEFAQGTLRPLLNDVLVTARKAGVVVKGYIENYYPHRVPGVKQLRSGKKREEILDATVKEGWFNNIEEATEQLDNFIARIDNASNEKYLTWMINKGLADDITQARVLWESVFADKSGLKYCPLDGSLKFSRTAHTPFYDRNVDAALVSYFKGTAKSIAAAKSLGGSGLMKVNGLLKNMRNLYGDSVADHAQKMLHYHLGVERPLTMKKWERTAMTLQTLKLNHLSSVLNMTQGLATGVRVGGVPFFKTLGKVMFSSKGRKEMTEYGRHMGAAMQQSLTDVMTMTGGGGSLSGSYLKGIHFKKTEQIIRGFAANVGKEGAIMKYNKFARLMEKGKVKNTKEIRRWFNSLDIDVAKLHKSGEGLNQSTLDRIASRISDEVNFTGTELDLPMSWLGPGGRVVAQFKSFVYGQSKLLAKSVVKEAVMHGNLKPAAFLFTMYPPVGMSFDYMINEVIRGKDGPDSMLERYFRGLMTVGGVAVFESILFGLHYGLAEAALGPTLGDMTDSLEKLYKNDFDVTRDVLGRYGPFGINTAIRRLGKEDRKDEALMKNLYK